MEIKILGPGCRNCETLEERTRSALTALNHEATISKVTDYGDISAYGVMQTPALVINERVVLSGRVPTIKALQALIGELI